MKLVDMLSGFFDARPKKKPSTHPDPLPQKRVSPNILSYSTRTRGQWVKPEYNFATIQEAQDTDSFIGRSIAKKVQRLVVAGWEFHSLNEEALQYIKRRIAEIELVSNSPFPLLIENLAHDLARYCNCMVYKVRSEDSSSGKLRVDLKGRELKPVASYEVLPLETLKFQHKNNGQLIKAMQEIKNGAERKEFSPDDLIHIYTNKKPGFTVGTPLLNAVLDDVALLRRIEENVEELIETNLFPVWHYTVGSDEFPELVDFNGRPESDAVKANLECMPPGAFFVSNHRHKIEALGSESKALRIDFYLGYFKQRVMAGLGISGVDFGEADASGKTAANTMSKNLIQEVESLQYTLKVFIEKFMLEELLLEGGFDPISDYKDKVYIKFGIIDRSEASAIENGVIQLFASNLVTIDEARMYLGRNPFTEEQLKQTHYSLFAEPLAMISSMVPGAVASSTLAAVPTSNVTPQQVKQAEAFAAKQAKAKAVHARPGKPSGKATSGAAGASAGKARPSNQHGTRAGAKTTKDALLEVSEKIGCPLHGASPEQLDLLCTIIQTRADFNRVSIDTAIASVHLRIKKLYSELE